MTCNISVAEDASPACAVRCTPCARAYSYAFCISPSFITGKSSSSPAMSMATTIFLLFYMLFSVASLAMVIAVSGMFLMIHRIILTSIPV